MGAGQVAERINHPAWTEMDPVIANLTTAKATVFKATQRTKVTVMKLANRTSGAVTATVRHISEGETSSSSEWDQYTATPLPANDTLREKGNYEAPVFDLAPGDYIEALASANTSVNLILYGVVAR